MIKQRPKEHDYASYVAYGRALEDYCNALEGQLKEQEPVEPEDTLSNRRIISKDPGATISIMQEMRRTIDRLKAKPEQEPKAWWDAKLGVFDEKHFDQLQPLYTAPPQRQWVGLTGKEKDECEEWLGHTVSSQVFDVIEDKLKEKNT